MKDCPDCQIREVADRLLKQNHDVTEFNVFATHQGMRINAKLISVRHDPRSKYVLARGY